MKNFVITPEPKDLHRQCDRCPSIAIARVDINDGTDTAGLFCQKHLEPYRKLDRLDHLKIWAFDYAPEEYQNLSTFGGDEDWVIFHDGTSWAEFDRLVQGLQRFAGHEQYDVVDGHIAIIAH